MGKNQNESTAGRKIPKENDIYRLNIRAAAIPGLPVVLLNFDESCILCFAVFQKSLQPVDQSFAVFSRTVF